jgi:hypothetical protein
MQVATSLALMVLLLAGDLSAQWSILGPPHVGDSLLSGHALALDDDGQPLLLQKGQSGWAHWSWNGSWQAKSVLGLPAGSAQLLQLDFDGSERALLASDQPLIVFRLENDQWTALGNLPPKSNVKKLEMEQAADGKLWLACSWQNLADSSALWAWNESLGWQLAWQSEAELGGFGLNDQGKPILLLNSPSKLLRLQNGLIDSLQAPLRTGGSYLELKSLYDGSGTSFVALHRDNSDGIHLDTFALGQWRAALWQPLMVADAADLELSQQGVAFIVGSDHGSQNPPKVLANHLGNWQLIGGLNAYNYTVSQPILALGQDRLYLAFLDDESPSEATVMHLQNPLSNEEEAMPGKLQIFPNPCRETLHLHLENSIAQAELRILDIWGREMQRASISSGKDVQIELEELPAGTYLVQVQIRGKGGQILQGKFLKLP